MAIIQENLDAKVMRNKMESKEALATKGALYVGTGDTTEVTPNDGGDAVNVPITSSIAPNGADDNGKVLVADSNETVGWTISDTCPKAKAVTTDIGTQKITDIFESDGKTAKSATIAKGLQSNTAQTTNGTNWYEFNGTNEYFGSTNSPTIIRTSETRPKAEVPSGSSTVTKEIALLEDIPQVGEWVTVPGTRATLTEAGTYQVIASNMQSIIYWDGSTSAEGAKSTKPTVVGASAYLNINTVYPYIDASGTLSLKVITVSDSVGKWAESTSQQAGFKYRKIH